MNFLRHLVFLFALLAMPFAFHGCNTFEGAGEDVEGSGEAIEETADDWED